jgi:hypothetical protein
MMQHQRKNHRLLVIAACAVVFCNVTLGAVVEIAAPGTAAPAEQRPPEGIRSYGPGAVLQERAALEPGKPQSEHGAESAGVKISGTPMAGAVNAFALTPDGATAVYIADQDTAGLYELYSVPVGGAPAPIKISDGNSSGVALFRIAAGGTQAVFLSDARLGGGLNDLYSVPLDGTASPVRLNTTAQAPVSAVGVAPDGAVVAFFGVDTAFGGGATEVYRASIGSASSGVQLSDVRATNAAGNVVAADFSANSATMFYACDAGPDDVFQWHSVALSAPGPGSDVQLSNALNFVSLGVVSPDNTKLIYTADENLAGVLELFSVSLDGGAKVKLNPSMAGSGVTSVRVSGDGARVAYLADQLTAGVIEVFGAQVGIAGSGVRLNSPLGGTQTADVITIGPDGATVLYEADENVAGTFDLLSAPIDASGAPNTLHAMTPPGNAGFFSGLGTPVVGSRAVYSVIGTEVDLYSVPFAGGSAAVQINGAHAAGDTVRGAFIPTSATRLMAYGVGATGGITETIFAAPIRADLAPEQANTAAGAGSVGVLDFAVTADESYVVYLQDQGTAGKAELYRHALDSDQDTVANAADNCPFFDNIAQDGVVFGQAVRASDSSTFVWDSAVDVRYVRGPLASVASLVTDDSGTLIEADSFTDTTTPAAGSGHYYLFAVDCAGRSYQTALGAEGGRDTAGLP